MIGLISTTLCCVIKKKLWIMLLLSSKCKIRYRVSNVGSTRITMWYKNKMRFHKIQTDKKIEVRLK